MEAVPRLPMISFDLKISPENPDFNVKLKQMIAELGEDPSGFDKEIKELESLRANTCIRPSETVDGVAIAKKYYCQLLFLKNRFKLHSDSPFQFPWKELYSNVKYSVSDMNHELASVLYNIGALHSRLGAQEERQESDGMKMAVAHFQCAAWAFHSLPDKYPQDSDSDLSSEVLAFESGLCLAQAQECILEKSLLDNRKPGIIAKVCGQVVEYYKQALKQLDTSNSSTLTDNVDSFLDIVGSKQSRSWRAFIEFKISYYVCLSYLHMGMSSEETGRWGDRVAYYKAASDAFRVAFNLNKEDRVDNLYKGVNEALIYTNDVVNGKLEISKKENEFIYHEKVPDVESLPSIKGASLVKGIPFDPTDPEVSGGDLFSRIVTLETHAASSMYSEELAKILRSVGGEIEVANDSLVLYLSSLQLEDIPDVDLLSVMPQEIIDCCAGLSVRPQCVPQLQQAMAKLASVSADVEASLQEIQQMLKEEERSEEEFCAVMGPRPKPIMAELERETQKYHAAHSMASESNLTLHTAMQLHVKNLKLLSQPVEKLKDLIPSLDQLDEKTLNSLEDMRKIMSKVEEMRNQRTKLEQDLRNAVQNDDITSRIAVKGNNEAEKMFEEELKKHDKVIGYIRQNITAQSAIVQAMSERNAEYADARYKVDNILRNREENLGQLVASYHAYEDLLNKTTKGLEFYDKLDGNVSKLLDRVKGVVKVQDEERTQVMKSSETKAAEARALSLSLISGDSKMNFSPAAPPAETPDTDQTMNFGNLSMNPASAGAGRPKLSDYLSGGYKPQPPMSQPSQPPISYPSQPAMSYPSQPQPFQPPAQSPITSDAKGGDTNRRPKLSDFLKSRDNGGAAKQEVLGIRPQPVGSSNPDPPFNHQQPFIPPNSTAVIPPQHHAFPHQQQLNQLPSTQQQEFNQPSSAHQNFGQPPSTQQQEFNQPFSTQQPSSAQQQQLFNQPPTIHKQQLHQPILAQQQQQFNQQPSTQPQLYQPPPVQQQFNQPSSAQKQQFNNQPQQPQFNQPPPLQQQQNITNQPLPQQPQYNQPSPQQVRQQPAPQQQQEQRFAPPKQQQIRFGPGVNPPNQQQVRMAPGQQQHVQPPPGVSPQQFAEQHHQPQLPLGQALGQPMSAACASPMQPSRQGYMGQHLLNQANTPANSSTGRPGVYSSISQSSPTVTFPNQMTANSTKDTTSFTATEEHKNNYYVGGYQNIMDPRQQQHMAGLTPQHNGSPIIHQNKEGGYVPEAPGPRPNMTTPNAYPGMMNHIRPQMHQMPGMQLMSRLAHPLQLPQHMNTNQVGPGNTGSQSPGYPMSGINNSDMDMRTTAVQHQPGQLPTRIEPKVSSTPETVSSIDSSSNVSILSELSVPVAGATPAVPMPGTYKPNVSSPTMTIETLKELDDSETSVIVSSITNMNTEGINIEKKPNQNNLARKEIPESFMNMKLDNLENLFSHLDNKTLEDQWKSVLMQVDLLQKKKESVSVARCYPYSNRAPDVLPFDFNRLVLQNCKDDYINASLVSASDAKSGTFIVTQTPISKDKEDFWSMIWQEGTETVVSLVTDQDMGDGGYLPLEKNRSMKEGKFSVTVQSIKQKEMYIERVVNLNNENMKQTRAIIHIQLLSKDNRSMSHVAMAMMDIRAQQRFPNKPVLVHCKDGGNKSGTFIALVSLIMEMEKLSDEWPDVKSKIAHLLSQRKGIIREKLHIKDVIEALVFFLKIKLGKDTENKKSTTTPAINAIEQDFVGLSVASLKAELQPCHPPILDVFDSISSIAPTLQGETKMDNSSTNLTTLELDIGTSPVSNIPVDDLTKLADLSMPVHEGKSKKISKDDFNSPAKKLGLSNDPSDPLGQLDPLWSLK